jgi:hypothetical protein
LTSGRSARPRRHAHQRQMAGRENRENKRNPLPWVATGCHDPKMVRRGSTVRVRQRALKSSQSGDFCCRIGAIEHLLRREGIGSRVARRASPRTARTSAVWPGFTCELRVGPRWEEVLGTNHSPQRGCELSVLSKVSVLSTTESSAFQARSSASQQAPAVLVAGRGLRRGAGACSTVSAPGTTQSSVIVEKVRPPSQAFERTRQSRSPAESRVVAAGIRQGVVGCGSAARRARERGARRRPLPRERRA